MRIIRATLGPPVDPLKDSTPRPWTSVHRSGFSAEVPAAIELGQADGDRLFVAAIMPKDGDVDLETRNVADGQLIMRAVNAHEDLLLALKLLLQEVLADNQAIACIDLRIIDRAKAAIAKGDGK